MPGSGFSIRRRNLAGATGSSVGAISSGWAAPDQLEAFLAFHLDQGGVCREARPLATLLPNPWFWLIDDSRTDTGHPRNDRLDVLRD